MDHVVVDVEIQKCVEDLPRGWDQTEDMGVAVACLWDYTTARMRVYGPDDVPALRERLLAADRISGYNIWNFDFPVIWGIPKRDWLKFDTNKLREIKAGDHEIDGVRIDDTCVIKARLLLRTNDLLRRIWQAQGFNPDVWNRGMGGSKLDDIAGATLGTRKIADGASAPREYQKGRVQWVVNYCADDVALERDLTDFVDRYGYVIHNGKQLFLKDAQGGGE